MREGDDAARDALVPLVYRDLEAIAAAYTRRPGGSLEPRGLVQLGERLREPWLVQAQPASAPASRSTRGVHPNG
jgi:hypothetical protein